MENVRPMFEEMLNLHVEYKDLSPLIVKRSIKLFIDQFDPYKIYLLSSEVEPFLQMSDDDLMKVVENFYVDDFSTYQKLNGIFQKSIQRAKRLRAEVVKEILSSSTETTAKGELYTSYARSLEDLKGRFKTQMLSILANEKKLSGSGSFGVDKKQKLFAMWERRFARSEASYLPVGAKARLDDHYLALHVLKSQSKSLDAHTTFFSPEEALEMRTSLEKQFEGVGIVLREGIDGVQITNVVKGGPAERSGKILPGDMLVEIDGRALEKLSYDEILSSLKGERGSKVILGVKRQNQSTPSRVELVREKIVMQDERLQFTTENVDGGIIGKIVLPSFYESGGSSSCEKDMREAIKALKRQGNLLGLVVDMRDNSGGFLNQAVKLAGLFISSGVIVISKYSKGEMQYLRDVDGRSYYDGPLVILTSKASASAAEIVAQALQDYGVAVVVGDDRTYGKGTIQYQTVTDDQAENFYKVTVGRYYTVSGRSTQIEGVKADIVVPTEYAPYNIGERYLSYPLKNDQVAPVYSDPLVDVDPKNKNWFQKNYLPNIQKKLSVWTQLLPTLKANSGYRIGSNKKFAYFMKTLEKGSAEASADVAFAENLKGVDLQMEEAVEIVKDMILLKNSENHE
jgi:carboxyl-terminal processing protease